VFDRRGAAEGARERLRRAVSWFVFGILWICRFARRGMHLRTENGSASFGRGVHGMSSTDESVWSCFLPREHARHREEGEYSAMAQPKDQEWSHPCWPAIG
jgi:hypothetical protein